MFLLDGLHDGGERTPAIREYEQWAIQQCHVFIGPLSNTNPQQKQVKEAFQALLADVQQLLPLPTDQAYQVLRAMVGKIERAKNYPLQDAITREWLHAKVPNFAEVIPGIYRSGQPSEQGIYWLNTIGIKTVVNLRDPAREPKTGYVNFSIDDEKNLVESLGMQYIALSSADRSTDIWMNGQVEQMLEIVAESANLPIVIHCMAGLGRTGTMAGILQKNNGYSNDAIITAWRRCGLEPECFLDQAKQANQIIMYKP